MADSIDSLITNAGQIAATSHDSIANIIDGAQNGLGANYANIDAATPLVMPRAIPILMQAPTMFDGVDYATEILKALVERHPKEISGIDFGYQLETAGIQIGHDSQELHMPTNAKRTPITPTFTWNEVVGNAVWNFHRWWIRMIKDCDTQISGLSAIDPDTPMSQMVVSTFSMSILWILFDSTWRPENIIDGFFTTAMFPTETGMLNAKFNLGHNETVDRTVAYTGLVQHNANTKTAAQIVADSLGLHRVNYNFATPLATAPDSTLSGMGLELEALNDAAQFLELDF